MLSFFVASAVIAPSVTFAPTRSMERNWLGPDFFANNLQDWEINRGRYECTETRLPVRTAQLLTWNLSDRAQRFSLSMDTGSIGEDKPGWRGFLIGAGGKDVDYRITALVHQAPAEDGGILAYMDEKGNLVFRDFSGGGSDGNQWSLSNQLDLKNVPVIEGEHGRNPESTGNKIYLDGEPEPDGEYTLYLRAGWAVYRVQNIPAHQVEGSIALMSHDGGDGHWFDNIRIEGEKVDHHAERAFGPVMQVMYTVNHGTLKLTAQSGPLGENDPKEAELQFQTESGWKTVTKTTFDEDAFTYRFRLEGLKHTKDIKYRVKTSLLNQDGPKDSYYEGIIPVEPAKEETVAAVFTCFKSFTGNLKWNGNSIWFPHAEVARNVEYLNPDILVYTGDQIYEGDLTPARLYRNDARSTYLDYLAKFYRFCWSMGDLTRNKPSICMPDDHDVYHGNIWGAGGKQAKAENGLTIQDSGGYKGPAEFVNAVHRGTTSHLPDPFDPELVGEMKLRPYATTLDWGGVSFAILADRMFKDSPSVKVPAGDFQNGWSRKEGFDPAKDADVPGAVLLGEGQHNLLRHWAETWDDSTVFKAVVSQTLFTNPATIPDTANGGEVIPSIPIGERGVIPSGFKIAADGDSNAWPQTARNEALRLIRKAYAVHMAGDQHLSTLVQYGIDDFRDAGYAFCVPAVGNTWPRRWFPPMEGMHRWEHLPAYTGDFFDGFGNKMTVWAAANPYKTGQEPAGLYDRTPGFGVIRFNKADRNITFECWPRWVDLKTAKVTDQYVGWPKTVNQFENFRPNGWLLGPELDLKQPNQVVRIYHVMSDGNLDLISAVRISQARYAPFVPTAGKYVAKIGERDQIQFEVKEEGK
ncbi:MAG: alkaline phosphatase D family protein [Armatimonadetes bacterium]|nr:alkaline phosphatase D family protein [Armatimonadota bacterium]